MQRVFFDANAGNEQEGYILWFDQSRSEIDQLPAEERDGAEVTLYMPDEIELVARLRWDASLNCWRGVPVPRPSG